MSLSVMMVLMEEHNRVQGQHAQEPSRVPASGADVMNWLGAGHTVVPTEWDDD
jgi:hypothetical protein